MPKIYNCKNKTDSATNTKSVNNYKSIFSFFFCSQPPLPTYQTNNPFSTAV